MARAERFKVVSVQDEALSLSVAERFEYSRTRDYSLVEGKCVMGEKPVIFHVREVPHGLWEEFVDAPDTYPEKYKRAFMCGVEKVENLPNEGGYQTWAPKLRHARSNKDVMSDEEMYALFSPSERQEIGSVVYTHSFLPRRTAATYQLPPTCHDPLVRLGALLVERSQATAAATTSETLSAPSNSTQSQDATPAS